MVTVSLLSSARTAVTTSRIASSGRRRSTPTLLASGSHHAPSPQIMRPGARSSRVENIDARRAGLRVQMSITPDPILIVVVVAPKAAIGTLASRTSRESACHTASKPFDSAYWVCAIASSRGCASCR